MVFVAIGDDKKPATVEPWVPVTENDKALAEAAVKWMQSSKAISEETRDSIEAGYE